MAVNEKFKMEIDSYESEIETMLAQLELIKFAIEKVKNLKEIYEELRNKYYGNRLVIVTENGLNESNQMPTLTAKYCETLENVILPSVREIHKLASSKQLAVNMLKNQVSIDDVIRILENYNSMQDDKYIEEKLELRDYLITFFYDIIKKDCLVNNRYQIIDILYEYKKKGCDFIKGVGLLFMKEVKELYDNAKDKGKYIKLVKVATTNEFNKEDIITLLTSTGKLKEEKANNVNTIDFNEAITKFETINYTNRNNLYSGYLPYLNSYKDTVVDLGSFYKNTGVNPLPRTEEENLKLREYDLSLVDYGRTTSKIRKKRTYYCPNLEGVNLSYTNVVLNFEYLGVESIRGANLEGVDLRGVDLTGIDIEGANLLKTGADIRHCKGTCLGVSAYEEDKKHVSDKKITPMKFQELTTVSPFSGYSCKSNSKPFGNVCPWHNRILRQFDLSCVDYSYEYIIEMYNKLRDHHISIGKYSWYDYEGLDFSYTNIDINPQEFKDEVVLNLEGVDLRDKDFTGVEKYFRKCNLKGTGANIDPKYNHTVSEYVIPSRGKSL